jgi:muramoyltetrapeptide carboxypeptidase
LLDYRVIRAYPKIFIGYSDITSLHCALLVKCNLVSFHAPMLCSDFLRKKPSDFALQGFLRTLMQPEAAGPICRGYAEKTVRVLRAGTATGLLLGGNLSILCASLGTPFQPSFKKAVLFLEEVDEEPYRFDRMLTQLLNAGLLQQVAGIAIGINKNCKDPKRRKGGEYRQSVEDVFCERLRPLKIPIVSGLPFGHVVCNATLPVGVRVMLDGRTGDLVVMESAVN